MGSVDTILEHFDDPDALSHHGVKGMKWGVRRSQAELDRAAGRVSEIRKGVEKGKKTYLSKALKTELGFRWWIRILPRIGL